jgi:predicted cobalt transporter CbtA
MKYLWIVFKVYAFAMLLFVPSIALIAAIAYAVGQTQTWWFAALSVAALGANLAVLISKRWSDRVWRKFNAIAGNRTTV